METGILLTILIVGVVLRLPRLGDSFYGDEAFSLLRDSDRFLTNSEDRFRPVFFSLLYLWKQLGFQGEIGLRLLPLLFGVGQIPLAYLIGLRLRGVGLGRGFALLIALSPMLIEFSQELRMYSLVAMLALLQVWILLRLLEQRSFWGWTGLIVAGLLGVYAHLHYWIFIAGLILTLVRERRVLPLWQSGLAVMTMVMLYLPNLPNIATFVEVRGAGYGIHLASALPKILVAFTAGFNYFSLSDTGTERAVGAADVGGNLILFLLFALPAVIIAWGAIRAHFKENRGRALWLGHELCTVPLLLATLASLVTGKYWLQPKYLIFSTPFALLLIAQAWPLLKFGWRRWLSAGLGLIVALVALRHFWDPVHYGRREDWRSAAQRLRNEVTDGTALILVPGAYRLLPYYWPEARERWTLVDVPQEAAEEEEFAAELSVSLSGKREIFYLWWDTAQNENDPRNRLFVALDRFANRQDSMSFNPRLKLYRWRLPGS